MDPLTPDEFLGTNDTKTEGRSLAYITGKSEGVKALLKDIFAEAGVPTVGGNDLVDLDPPLFLPASDLVRFLGYAQRELCAKAALALLDRLQQRPLLVPYFEPYSA